MSASALCLNLLVSGLAIWNFCRAGHFSWHVLWPFLAGSIPAAFLGSLFKTSAAFYDLLLAAALFLAALRLLGSPSPAQRPLRNPPPGIALGLGTAIGVFSGMVGIGGGIILSPLLLLCRWADAKQTAAASAVFIFLNSAAGLLGRVVTRRLIFEPSSILGGMVLACFLGGVLGSRLGANHFSNRVLRRVLAVVLLFAAVKLFRSL